MFLRRRDNILLYVRLSLGLILFFSLARSSSTFAQNGTAFVRHVRAMESDETGVSNPAGLAFSPRANSFHAVEAHGQGQPPPAEMDVVRLTPFADRVGSARIAAAIKEPINTTYDPALKRLLVFQSAPNRLIEVRESADGTLDPTTLIRHDARHLGLQNPQGMAVDPRSGHLFILESTGPWLVRVEPEPDGSFDNAVIARVDLQPTGLVDPRGLAFDPTTGHLHVVNPTEFKLYELTQTGQVVATRDLSQVELTDPQGMVFAPSGDLTDDPGQMSLYVADRGVDARGRAQGASSAAGGQTDSQASAASQSSGQIVELSFAQPVAPAASDFEASLIRTVDMAALSPPSPDPSGLAYLSSANTLLVSDGEVEETVGGITHFQGANIWELTLSGAVVRTANISKVAPTVVPLTNEPTGVAWDPGTGHFFVTDDGTKKVYRLNPGADRRIGTSDDTWTSFDTRPAGNMDPEGITYDTARNRLFVADGVNQEVYEYTTDGVLVGQFDVERYGVVDPESVEFNPSDGTLFVMSSNRSTAVIVETTTGGALVRTIGISATNARAAAGLAYAPASDGSSARRFYIVDRGIDNNADPRIIDGKMYEMSAPSSGTNSPPIANDDSASTPTDTPVTINVASNDSDPDGNLDPASANTACPACANPAAGTLVNNGDGTFRYTPDSGFTGNDSFVYQICDRTSLCDTATVSIAVTPTASDLIFADGFESGNLSAWSSSATDAGDLSVSAAAALVGSNGMQALIDDSVAIYVTDDTPNAERHYRARFHFDPNSISMASGDNHFIFYGYSGTSQVGLRAQFRFRNGSYQLRAALRSDGSTWANTSWFTMSDAPHVIELDWRAATAAGANNGGLTLWIDGAQRANLTGVDNDARRIDRVRLGAVAGLDAGTRGTYYFDAFESRR